MIAAPTLLEIPIARLQRAFLTAPAMTLTVAETESAFGLDRATCEAMLGALVDARVVFKTRDGAYRRHFPRPDYDAPCP